MIVMKFGGTSVEDATAIARVAEIVRGRLSKKPVVVVSALAGVTDQLLDMGEAARAGEAQTADQQLLKLRARHLGTASASLSPASFSRFRQELESKFAALQTVVGGISALRELSPRASDQLLSFGERLSSRIVTAAFLERGLDAVLVDARECLVTDGAHTRAAPVVDLTEQRTRDKLLPLLEQTHVPVMGGFIAATVDGVTTTVGRGGSDLSAAIVGAVLDAERVEIWTDVDGMMTTDPKTCPHARRIRSISFEEATELAYFGARVLHPATLLPAMDRNIPVYILNSRNPSSPGTCIRARARRSRVHPVTAIAAKKNLLVLDLSPQQRQPAHEFLGAMFNVLERHNCPLHIVATSDTSVSLPLNAGAATPALLAELELAAKVEREESKAIVCLVGQGLRSSPGVLARAFAALGDLEVRMVSQGASKISFSFVVAEQDADTAVHRLHAAFFANAGKRVVRTPAIPAEIGVALAARPFSAAAD